MKTLFGDQGKYAGMSEALPFDYQKVGEERYAWIWSIRNMYDTYEKELEIFEHTERQEPEYVERLYRIYRVQTYMKDPGWPAGADDCEGWK